MRIKIPVLLCILFLLSGCGSEQQKTNKNTAETVSHKVNNSIESGGRLVLDNTKKSEYQVSSEAAETITIPLGSEAKIDITFMEGSVEGKRTFELAPVVNTPGDKDEYLTPGFFLSEKGSNGSVKLKAPASICYMSRSEIPPDTVIVKYDESGHNYIVVPTQRVNMQGAHGLIAFVNSFSGYGVKKVTREEIEKMADALENVGFDWILDVDDHYRVMTPDGADTTLQFKALMKNTKAPNNWVMHGPYNGQAALGLFFVKEVGAELGGQSIPAAAGLMLSDRKAGFRLYPVFDEIKSGKEGQLPLTGLVPKYYVGRGTLELKLDTVGFLSMEDNAVNDDEPTIVPFTVITRGPVAYVTLDYYGLGLMKFKGGITGNAKKTEKQLSEAEDIELVPLTAQDELSKYEPEDNTVDLNGDGKPDAGAKSGVDGSIEFDKNADGNTDQTVKENADGSFSYDWDGDGQTDFTLEPLIKKK